MLRQRLVTAFIGLPILFSLLWLNWYARARLGSPDNFPLLAIVILIAAASGWEISQIVRVRYPNASLWNGLYAALIIPFLVHSAQLMPIAGGPPVPISSLALLIDALGSTSMVLLLFLGIWSDVENRGMDGIRENLVAVGAGLYVGAGISFLLSLGHSSYHEIALVFIFVVVFGLDTAAYFGGKMLRGPLLAPKISPKKTLSGALVGMTVTALLALVFKFLPGDAYNPSLGADHAWWYFLIMGLIIAFFGLLGDLMESWLKRWGGVKDSGSAIPGHGGFLDRFDSLFLAAPAFYVMLLYFK